METQFRPYSLGVAAENKSLTSRHLAITPHEITPGLDGEISFNPEEKIFSGFDKDGNEYQTKVTEDSSITAEWIPFGSNRFIPPDVRRGEPVMIYRLADTDRYYWRCLGLRDDLRRLETVIYAFNANPDENANGISLDNCYYIEISTHQKLITLGTSQANGEPYGYAIQLDTGEGKFSLEDTLGNMMHLDTGRILWEFINAAETHVKLDKEHIYMFAHNSIEMEGSQLVHMKTTNFVLEASDSFTLTAGNGIYMEASTISTKSDSVSHDTPEATYTGNLNVGGSLGVSGGMSTGSEGTGGDCNIGGRIVCAGIDSSENISAPNI